jgi:MFS family permease
MVSIEVMSVFTEHPLTTPGSAIGSIIGLIANGFLCDRFGYKKVMVFALTLMTLFIFFPFSRRISLFSRSANVYAGEFATCGPEIRV